MSQPPKAKAVRSPREVAIIEELYARKSRFQQTHAYVTATEPMRMSHWNGKHPPEQNMSYSPVNPGDTLKILMVSRFGDFGLTTDLKAETGYGLRVDGDSPAITDIRWTVEPTPKTEEPEGEAKKYPMVLVIEDHEEATALNVALSHAEERAEKGIARLRGSSQESADIQLPTYRTFRDSILELRRRFDLMTGRTK